MFGSMLLLSYLIPHRPRPNGAVLIDRNLQGVPRTGAGQEGLALRVPEMLFDSRKSWPDL